jgi:hypothetical protein
VAHEFCKFLKVLILKVFGIYSEEEHRGFGIYSEEEHRGYTQ